MFSKSTEYALRAAIYIAKEGNIDNKVNITQISEAIGSPKSFTAKILQILCRKNDLITSITGPGGGFYFTEKTLDKPVMAIIDAMGERSRIESCVLGLHKCSSKNPCPMHHHYKKIKPELIRLFEEKSIRQLAFELDAGKVLAMSSANE